MTGFRAARRGRRGKHRAADDGSAQVVVIGTFAPVEVVLLRQFVSELMLLLQAEVGARPVEDGVSSPSSTDRPSEGSARESAVAPAGVDAARLSDEDVESAFAALTGLEQPAPGGAPIGLSEDRVIARLLPDAYAEDLEAAADFRRFTQDRLVAAKYASATAVLAALPKDPPEGQLELPLAEDEAQQWLRTLNDIRLALGTRLDVRQDDDDRWSSLPEDDPRSTVHEIYQWLGWVQETLVASLRP